jgi:hypothetical protein
MLDLAGEFTKSLVTRFSVQSSNALVLMPCDFKIFGAIAGRLNLNDSQYHEQKIVLLSMG